MESKTKLKKESKTKLKKACVLTQTTIFDNKENKDKDTKIGQKEHWTAKNGVENTTKVGTQYLKMQKLE